MEVEVLQEHLTKALTHVSRVASNKASLPILGNILLRTSGSQLIIAATNLEVSSIQSIGAKVLAQGTLTVPARLVADLVSNLPKEIIHLTVKGNILHLQTGSTQSKINGVSDEEFPELPTVDESKSVTYTLSVDDFKLAAQQTIVAAGSDATRPVLTGIYWHTFEGNLYFAATDGYRLSEKRIMKAKTDIAAIVPVSTIQEVLRLADDESDKIDIFFDDTQVTFKLGNGELTSRLVDGNYPDYRQLIPTSSETVFEVPISDMKRVVKLSSLFSRSSGGSITLEVTEEGGLTVHSTSSEVGDNVSDLVITSTAKPGTVTLNSRYLNDALSVLHADTISFGFSGKLAPCLLSGKLREDYKHIIMPIKS